MVTRTGAQLWRCESWQTSIQLNCSIKNCPVHRIAGKTMSQWKIKGARAAVKLAAKYMRQRLLWWWWLRAAERCEEVLLDKWLRWRLLGQRKRGRLNRRRLGTINNMVTRWCLKIEDTNDGRDGDQWKNLEARWTVTYQ